VVCIRLLGVFFKNENKLFAGLKRLLFSSRTQVVAKGELSTRDEIEQSW